MLVVGLLEKTGRIPTGDRSHIKVTITRHLKNKHNKKPVCASRYMLYVVRPSSIMQKRHLDELANRRMANVQTDRCKTVVRFLEKEAQGACRQAKTQQDNAINRKAQVKA